MQQGMGPLLPVATVALVTVAAAAACEAPVIMPDRPHVPWHPCPLGRATQGTMMKPSSAASNHATPRCSLTKMPLLLSKSIAQERYREYRRCMAEQQLSPVRLRDFFKHSDERGVPAL